MELTERDHRRLQGVKERLVKVVEKAAETATMPFTVSEGLRSLERQRMLVQLGKSKTMYSKHLSGDAVDLYPLTDDRTQIAWAKFGELADTMKAAAAELGTKIQWGGDWKKFIDKPHFELCE